MAPRSPISATVAEWLKDVREFFAYVQVDSAVVRHTSANQALLAGTLVRIQARYGTLNARIRRETDRLALWLLAEVDLPKGLAEVLAEGLSAEGQTAHKAGFVPHFKYTRVPGDPSTLVASGQNIVFDDEAQDELSYARRAA